MSDYEIRCMNCGSNKELKAYPHRDRNENVVGMIYVCADCEEEIKDGQIVLKRREKEEIDNMLRLKKDIVIPAGTILSSAPEVTVRYDKCVDTVFAVGNSKNSFGIVEYWFDDIEPEIFDEWFEKLEANNEQEER